MSAPSALTVAGLTRRFGGLAAVSDLSFAVEPGEVFGLLGPNGAGKTTALNLISGLDTPNSGTVHVGGVATTGRPPHELAEMGMARTYQNVKVFTGLSVADHVVIGLHLERRAKMWQMILPVPSEWRERRALRGRATELLDRVGLAGIDPEQPAETLSYGDQRRLEIARALAVRPTLLLLDEPTAGMNQQESTELGALLLSVRDNGVTLVIVEHNIDLVQRFCDRIVVMNFGELIAEGLPRATLDSPAVRDAYFGATGDERVDRLRDRKNQPSTGSAPERIGQLMSRRNRG